MAGCANPVQPRSSSAQGGQTGTPSLVFDFGGIPPVSSVHGELVDGSDTISFDAAGGTGVSYSDPRLAGKTWQTKLTIVAAGADYDAAYWYQGDVSFSSGALQLPSPDSDPWTGQLHVTVPVPESAGSSLAAQAPFVTPRIDVTRSVNPLHVYTVTVHMPSSYSADVYFDRGWWTPDGNAAGDIDAENFFIPKGGTVTVTMPDHTGSLKNLRWVDSLVSVYVEELAFEVDQLFSWEIDSVHHKPRGTIAHP